MTNDLSKDDLDILLDVGRKFKKRKNKIKKVQKAILKKRSSLFDSPERVKAFLKREALKEFQKVIIDEEAETDSEEANANQEIVDSQKEKQERLMDNIDELDLSDEIMFERLIGSTNDILSIEALEVGRKTANAVGMLEMGITGRGTGFLVGLDVILTNWHNIRDIERAKQSVFVLDFEDSEFGDRSKRQEFKLDPDRFYVPDKEFDFAFVAVKKHSRTREKTLDDYGIHFLFPEEGKIIVGQPVNIIHHPRGGRKQVTIHNSLLVELSNEADDEQFCYYTADTLKGSSGAPVYNVHWEVIALHRKGVPETDMFGKVILKNGTKIDREDMIAHEADIKWICNQGVRTSRIIRRFKDLELANPDYLKVRDELLEFWGAEDLMA